MREKRETDLGLQTLPRCTCRCRKQPDLLGRCNATMQQDTAISKKGFFLNPRMPYEAVCSADIPKNCLCAYIYIYIYCFYTDI